jgi:hypothetical protein
MALRLHAFLITIPKLFSSFSGGEGCRGLCAGQGSEPLPSLACPQQARLLTTWEQYTPYAAASKAVFSMYITLQLLFMAIHAMYLHQLHTCSRQIETATGISLSFCTATNARNLQERLRLVCRRVAPPRSNVVASALACLNSS